MKKEMPPAVTVHTAACVQTQEQTERILQEIAAIYAKARQKSRAENNETAKKAVPTGPAF